MGAPAEIAHWPRFPFRSEVAAVKEGEVEWKIWHLGQTCTGQTESFEAAYDVRLQICRACVWGFALPFELDWVDDPKGA